MVKLWPKATRLLGNVDFDSSRFPRDLLSLLKSDRKQSNFLQLPGHIELCH